MLFYKIRCKDTEIFANKQIKSLILLKFSRIFIVFTKFSAIISSFIVLRGHFCPHTFRLNYPKIPASSPFRTSALQAEGYISSLYHLTV